MTVVTKANVADAQHALAKPGGGLPANNN